MTNLRPYFAQFASVTRHFKLERAQDNNPRLTVQTESIEARAKGLNFTFNRQ